MAIVLLLGTIVMIAAILCNKLSHKIGVPMLLLFILLGMLFGSDGLFKIPFDNYTFAEDICSVALIFIIFYGGFGTNWREARSIAGKSILLSSAGVILTACFTGLFCRLALGFDWLESFLVGSVISSTDAASVFSILRSKKLALKNHTASLLEMESGSNDPFSYMLTIIVLSLMESDLQMGSFAYLLFAQIVYGLIAGVLIALAAVWFLQRFNFPTAGFDTLFVVAVALLAYALPSAIGGNGYLSAYIAGIIMGNMTIGNKPTLVHFFDGATSLMQVSIFFLLGLLCTPSQIPSILPPSLLITVFLTCIARPLAVFAILTPCRCPLNQQLLVSWSGLRGAASIVFAIMATVSPAYTRNDVFHIVFCVVLLSIAFQGTLLPLAARKLDMIDENANVLKTFNDYQELNDIQFIQLTVNRSHPWTRRPLKELDMPPDTLIIMLLRRQQIIIPKGDAVLQAGDRIVLSAPAFQDNNDVYLKEIAIGGKHQWVGKPISGLAIEREKLIVLIKRSNRAFVPKGTTRIRSGDVLVFIQSQTSETKPALFI